MSKFKKNQGAILIIVIFTVIILLLIGISFIFWLKVESRSASQKRAATKDFFYGELGSEAVIHRLQNESAFADLFISTSTPSGYTTAYTLIIDDLPIGITIQKIP